MVWCFFFPAFGYLGREPGLALYFLKGILIGVFFVIDTMVGCS